MMNQKTAVYTCIKNVKDFNDGDKVTLTKNEKEQVKSMLVNGFNEGQIELKSQQEDIGKYVNGLLNNWLRKDTRLNGGTEYKAKNPGSRTGQQDPQVKNLRLLKKTVSDPQALADIDAAIKARIAEIKPETVVEIDAQHIPAELQHLV